MRQDSDIGEDEALMLALRDGDDLALNRLMRRWKAPLIGFLQRYTGDHTVAVELAQETFIRVYQSRARYQVKGKFSTWLFTIAANLSRNHTRWKKRHPTVSLAEPEEVVAGLPDERDAPDAASVKQDEAAQVRIAVDRLPHPLRTAILLFEFEGQSHAEIAAILGCSEKAVETRLYRARQQLKKQLQTLWKEETAQFSKG